MKYEVFHTPNGVDPRHLDLAEFMGGVTPCATEQEAVNLMRAEYPDGIAMPVRLDSGFMMMGIVPDAVAATDMQTEHPTVEFVMLIQPVGDGTWADTKALQKGRAFTRELWAVSPVLPPDNSITDTAVVRVSQEGFPAERDVEIGLDARGRVVLYCEALPGNAISFTFDSERARRAAKLLFGVGEMSPTHQEWDSGNSDAARRIRGILREETHNYDPKLGDSSNPDYLGDRWLDAVTVRIMKATGKI